MACWDTPPYTCTYDSGGGKDYSSMSTWEGATDVDISGYGILILDCYDSQDHDFRIYYAGASGLDATHYRKVRSAAGCTTPFAGKRGTGATFHSTVSGTQNYAICLAEAWFRFESLCFDGDAINSSSNVEVIKLNVDHAKVINLVSHDCVNAGAGVCTCISLNEDQNLAYQCIAHDYDFGGFSLIAGAGESIGVVNCTVIDGTRGFTASANLSTYAWNCYGAGMSAFVFHNDPARWAGGGWNGSDDDTAEDVHADNNYKNLNLNSTTYFVSVTSGAEDYNLVQSADWDVAADQRAGRNPYNDFSAVITFDNFIWNGASCDPLFLYDIKGTARPTYTTADIAWDVGASEYVAPVPSAFIPKIIMIN